MATLRRLKLARTSIRRKLACVRMKGGFFLSGEIRFSSDVATRKMIEVPNQR